MSYVRYIDKTREYYLSEGYEKPYRWAHNEDIPFAPMKKSLSQCRVGLVSTSDVALRPEHGGEQRSNDGELVGNVYSLPSDVPADLLYSRQEAYDKYSTHLDDVNSYLPITRLHELAAEGKIASVAPRIHGVYTAYSQRKTRETDSPEVLKRCIEDEVDVVLLTPV